MLRTPNYNLEVPQASDGLKESLLVFIANSLMRIDDAMHEEAFRGEVFTTELKTKLESMSAEQLVDVAEAIATINTALTSLQGKQSVLETSQGLTDVAIGELNNQVTTAHQRIDSIKLALDDDGDGSIFDTIDNIKQLIDDESSSLAESIANKATKAEVLELRTMVESIDGGSQGAPVVTDKITGLTYEIIVENKVIKIEETSETIVIQTKEELVISSVELDSNIILPSAMNGCNISWASSNPGVISSLGNITRPEYGAPTGQAVLTASISKDGFVLTKAFDVTVKPKTASEHMNTMISVLNADMNTKLSEPINSSVELITNIEGVTVVWTSSNLDLLSHSGELISQPVSPEPNAELQLTAVLQLEDVTETQTFNLIVKARELNEEELLSQFKSQLIIPNSNELREDAELITEDTSTGITVSWSSSDETVITSEGIITRPEYLEADKTATMTATITLGEATEQKIIEVVVAAISASEQIILDKQLLTVEIIENSVELVSEIGHSSVLWHSSDDLVISTSGVITTPEIDTNVKLTATLTLEQETVQKEFDLLITADSAEEPTEPEEEPGEGTEE